MLSQLDERPILSVSALARQARLLIEERFNMVRVEGELSNFSKPASGHWYFTLKDDSAQIRCAMFAGRNRHVRLTPHNGNQVLVRGRVSLYEARGDFQIIVEQMSPAGEGALRAAFDQLKERLAQEGLFDEAGKTSLPSLPRHLTIISSASGAALQDVLQVIERRYPSLAVTLIATAVQGDAAEPQLLDALNRAARSTTDVVLITRGGGSLEDLWAFNLESVARAIAACPHPVVAAIGHQSDVTIADFVADVRAPTPSAGAELITPTVEDLEGWFRGHRHRLSTLLEQQLRMQQQNLRHLSARLVDPRQLLAQRMQRADELESRLTLAARNVFLTQRSRLHSLREVLKLLQPLNRLPIQRTRLHGRYRQLQAAVQLALERWQTTLAGSTRALHAVSPLATIGRGYAVLTQPGKSEIGEPVTSIQHVALGAQLTAYLTDGALRLGVNQLDPAARLSRIAPTDDAQDEDHA
jgi:exodeoxyribonuclease VII large subunit